MEYPPLKFNSDFRPWKFVVFQGPKSRKKKKNKSSNYPCKHYFRVLNSLFFQKRRRRQGFSRPQEPPGLPGLLATSPMGVRRRWFHPVPFPLPPPLQEPPVQPPSKYPKRPEIRWVVWGGLVFVFAKKWPEKKKTGPPGVKSQ